MVHFLRPTVAEIDLDALAHNYHQIRSRVHSGVKILAVVKDNAYGHGAVVIARELERLGVDLLGVAIAEEGVELRDGGIKKPILILSGIYEEEINSLFEYDLIPMVFDGEVGKSLSDKAKRKNRRVKVHLKFDTGMGRLGVPVEGARKFLEQMKGFPNLVIDGVASHFSMADEEYTRGQLKAYKGVVELFHGEGIRPTYWHISSSAPMIDFPDSWFNLIRPGIMIYGSYPSREYIGRIALRSMMRLRTTIGSIKKVPAGTKISYGGTYITRRESLIATLPIGYGDGYNRLLSNRGEALLKAKRVPIVGRICMDMTMVDVTDVGDASPRDEVVLMGRQGGDEIPVEEIAEKIGTISYEVLCGVGKRVPRVYMRGGEPFEAEVYVRREIEQRGR
ncbi:MAG: alanine racemase [Thermodesulfobacteriota bacterium]